MKINLKVFAVAFVFSFVIGFLSNISTYLTRVLTFGQGAVFWLSLLGIVHFVVNPFLLFVSFYLLGRKIDLVSEFLSVIVPLLIGNIVGFLIGYFSFELWYVSLYPTSFFGPILFVQFIVIGIETLFSSQVFVGFTALSIAYIVKKRTLNLTQKPL